MKALLAGDVPLVRAFWKYAILYGGLGNLCATAAAMAVLAAGWPTPWALAVFLSPAPYIVVATIGVWRSAEKFTGPRHLATMARTVSLLWGCAMILI